VLEYWSVVKKTIFESLLHHSNTPKILEIERYIKRFAFFEVIDPKNI